jgi:hypothetical protein
MLTGKSLQIISFALAFSAGIVGLLAAIFVSFVLVCSAGVIGLLAAISGFLGNRVADKGYWETFKSLSRNVESAHTRKEPIWAPFTRVDASQRVPPGVHFVRIQFRLWSDDNTIPLMIRTAAGKDGELTNEVAGPSGVIEQMMTESQAFYVSFSHPGIKYEVSVSGWTDDTL